MILYYLFDMTSGEQSFQECNVENFKKRLIEFPLNRRYLLLEYE